MKRFTDTEKWGDPWFQDLPPKMKLFWGYILDSCNAAGIWKVNLKLASFHVGETIAQDEAEATLAGRVEDLGNGYWWVKKFCAFQYGTLSDNCPPHRRVIDILSSYSLLKKVNGYSQHTEHQ